MSPWHRAVAALLVSWPCLAIAGPWSARTPQGLTLRVVQDSYRTRDGYVLEQSYPDGTRDTGFGQQGVTVFSLGPDNEGPAALRVDALGRAWIAGGSEAAGDPLQAVVLRFLPHGLPDTSYADNGRAATSPAGRPARALDLLPQPDGSTFVVGTVLDSQGTERSGWWRLDARGKVDPAMGLGGLWTDTGDGSTEVVELVGGADGSVALGLRRGAGGRQRLEAWVLSPGNSAPRLTLQTPNADKPRLVWRDGAWQWWANGAPLVAAAGADAAPQAGSMVTRAAAMPSATGAQAPRLSIDNTAAVGSASAAPAAPASAAVSSNDASAWWRLRWWWSVGAAMAAAAVAAWLRWRQRSRTRERRR